ncbi:hypothetical protein GCM10023093_11910 [Nemorincola caseinilytica]|uniref:Type II toxin-antitoxin system RelE/ParE family toxin n=1 Tax=Nemorincola caseinilytica TaxID=2054315 RepID=A0ABP8NC63_9BACT
MSYNIEVRPLAALEIIEAYDWYESQRRGLGHTFLTDLETFYDSLLVNPFTHSYYKNNVRQGILHKFPYTVVYEVFGNAIVVYSVFMDRRDPEKKRTG